MTTENLKKRIEINPDVLVGKPVIKGTRISVEQIMRMLAAGMGESTILEQFPHLKKQDIQAAVLYGAELVKDMRAYPREFVGQIKIL